MVPAGARRKAPISTAHRRITGSRLHRSTGTGIPIKRPARNSPTGRGIRPIERKEEALDAYRYHLAVENHIAPGHWSEKIADALLCECLPFYAGDPDLGRTLPPDSFIPIPIDDPPRAAEIINGAIAAGEYEKRLPAVREARKLILERYNFRDQVIEVIESAKDSPVTPVDAARPFFLLSRRRTRLTVRGAFGDIFDHALRLFGP